MSAMVIVLFFFGGGAGVRGQMPYGTAVRHWALTPWVADLSGRIRLVDEPSNILVINE